MNRTVELLFIVMMIIAPFVMSVNADDGAITFEASKVNNTSWWKPGEIREFSLIRVDTYETLVNNLEYLKERFKWQDALELNIVDCFGFDNRIVYSKIEDIPKRSAKCPIPLLYLDKLDSGKWVVRQAAEECWWIKYED